MYSGLHRQISRTHNVNIRRITSLPSPAQLKADLPITKACWQTVLEGRNTINDIIHGTDSRLLVAMGPCSIHNPKEALQYARWLKGLRDRLNATGSNIYIVMRAVFVKPRTNHDWTGFFNDPDMNGRCDIEKGWRLGRRLLLDITEMGIPVATEYLNVDSLQNVDDLYSFHWIGARSIEFQEYRDEASALSTPVGFKNPISGKLDIAFNSMHWAAQRNVLTAPHDNGVRARFETKGNPNNILILRGTEFAENCNAEQIKETSGLLEARGLNPRVIVDVNHGNSKKDHLKQADTIKYLGELRGRGSLPQLAGFMYESNQQDGKQKLAVEFGKRPRLRPGISVTDGCDGIERSEKALLSLGELLGSSAATSLH